MALLALGVVGIIAIIALRDSKSALAGLNSNNITKADLDSAVQKAIASQSYSSPRSHPEGSDLF